MSYCLRAKAHAAEIRALNELPPEVLSSIAVVAEPSARVNKREAFDRRRAATIESAVKTCTNFRGFYSPLSPARPRHFALDVNPVAATLGLDPSEIISEVARRLNEPSFKPHFIVAPPSVSRIDFEFLSLHASGVILRLTKEEIARHSYMDMAKEFVVRTAKSLPIGLMLELGYLTVETAFKRRTMVEAVLPRLISLASWKQIVISAYSCPKARSLPQPGKLALYPRPEMLMTTQLIRKFPSIEFCDRALVDEFFFPTKSKKLRPKKPTYLTLSGIGEYCAARATEIGDYATSIQKLARRVFPYIEKGMPPCRTAREWQKVVSGRKQIHSASARLAWQIALHVEVSVRKLWAPR